MIGRRSVILQTAVFQSPLILHKQKVLSLCITLKTLKLDELHTEMLVESLNTTLAAVTYIFLIFMQLFFHALRLAN